MSSESNYRTVHFEGSPQGPLFSVSPSGTSGTLDLPPLALLSLGTLSWVFCGAAAPLLVAAAVDEIAPASLGPSSQAKVTLLMAFPNDSP